jgi:Anti-sigma-K factor rskA/Putative zinc-finger
MTTQSLQCNDIQPWLAAYALGEAKDDPAARAHLATCPKCQGDLREYRAVAGLLPYAAAEATLPAELRGRVIAAIASAAEQQAVGAPPAHPQPALPRLRQRRPIAPRAMWVAVAFALVSLVLLFWNVSLQRQVDQQTAQLVASRQGWQSVIVILNDASLRWYTVSGEQAHGRIWATPQGEQACLVAEQLPTLAEGQVYQVWLAHGGEQASGGTFEAHNGEAWIILRTQEPIASYASVIVTIEPDGGSARPTGRRVLTGTLTSGTTANTADRLGLARLFHN